MPVKFDRMVRKIWASIKGKKNPRTGKPFTESDAYAIATAAWKKAHGGRAPGRSEKFSDWHIIEFVMPIKESATVEDSFYIKGIAINETTTRNGIRYIAQELEEAAPTFRNKPILLDHENKVREIVGRSTENVIFSKEKKGMEFEAKIMDKVIQSMITDGRVTDVSIGATVKDLIEDKEDNSMTAIGLEGLEISLVAVPGDPGANLATAMQESFETKQIVEDYDNFAKDILDKYGDDDLNNEKEVDKMAEEEKTQEEQPEESKEEKEEPAESEDAKEAEEKLKKAEAKIVGLEKQVRDDAISQYKKIAEAKKIKPLETSKMSTETIKVLIEQVDEVETPETESDTPAEEEPKEEPKEETKEESPAEDETKGEVGEEPKEETTEESLVVEKAESGKGFQIWRDYTKDTGNFKRLSR